MTPFMGDFYICLEQKFTRWILNMSFNRGLLIRDLGIYSFTAYPLLRQVHSLFQSKFSNDDEVVLSPSNASVPALTKFAPCGFCK
jgi:hypothetical protein